MGWGLSLSRIVIYAGNHWGMTCTTGQSQLTFIAVGETWLQIPVHKKAPTLPACIDATMQGGTTQDECTDRPDRPEASKKVRGLCVLVAVNDVQFLAAHESEHLTHCGLAGAGVTHQQSRLAVLHTPAPHTLCKCMYVSVCM